MQLVGIQTYNLDIARIKNNINIIIIIYLEQTIVHHQGEVRRSSLRYFTAQDTRSLLTDTIRIIP